MTQKEELEQAKAKITELEGNATKLAEVETKLTDANTALESANAKLAEAGAKITELADKAQAYATTISTLKTENEELKAKAKTTTQASAEQLAGKGLAPKTKDVEMGESSDAPKTMAEFMAAYNAIEDGAKAAAFYNDHYQAIQSKSRRG